MLLQKIESKLEWVSASTIIPIIIVMFLGLILRIYFTSWEIPLESPDAFIYLIYALAYVENEFVYPFISFLWPMFLSIFFLIFRYDDYFGYMTVMRIVSISLSLATVPIVFLITKEFVKKEYAILAAALFILEPNLVENSIFGITEPIFILIGLTSLYFVLREDFRFLPLAFLFAGLAFDARLNGIVLLFLAIAACFIKIKSNPKTIKYVVMGIGIFLLITLPYSLSMLNFGEIPFVNRFFIVSENLSEENLFPSTFISENLTAFNIIKNSLQNEFLHIFRISVPYLALFVPYGILIALKELDVKKKILFLTIIVTLVIAIPQYTQSAEYRNLFFLTPLFCILSVIGIQKILNNTDYRHLILVLLIGGLILVSFSFLRERYDFDQQLILEKEQFGKYVVNNIKGNVTGTVHTQISHNVLDARIIGQYVINNEFGIVWPIEKISTVERLLEYAKIQSVDYLILGLDDEKRFPVFQEIYFNEENYPYLEKIFDAEENNYKKLRVKIFKINYDILE